MRRTAFGVSSSILTFIGYVGGDALDHVYNAHSDYEYTLLVKNEQQAEPIKAKYPGVKFVYGTLEQSDLIRDTCLETDVVIRKSIE